MTRTLKLVPGPDLPARYAAVSGDGSPLHLDEAAARKAGLDGVVLHGMYLFGLAIRAASAEVAGDPRRVRAANVRFRVPGVPGAEVVIDVDTDAEDPSARRVRLRQNGTDLVQNGTVTLAGFAL